MCTVKKRHLFSKKFSSANFFFFTAVNKKILFDKNKHCFHFQCRQCTFQLSTFIRLCKQYPGWVSGSPKCLFKYELTCSDKFPAWILSARNARARSACLTTAGKSPTWKATWISEERRRRSQSEQVFLFALKKEEIVFDGGDLLKK